MRDRLSTKILSNGATRYGVYDETGNLLRYEYIKLEDEPTVEGDLFSKANMLPDSIPAALGLKMGNPQVKDALNVLANIGNVHVWQRVQTYAEPVPEVPAGYTLGAVEENVSITNTTSSTDTIVMYSATSLTVSNDGTISTSGFGSASGKVTSVIDQMYGKFIYFRAQDSDFDSNNIIFIPSDATRSWGDNGEVVVSKLQRVTGYPYTPAIPAGTTTDYLTSTDRNAYPDNVTDAQDAYYTLMSEIVGAFGLGRGGASTQMAYKAADSVNVSESGIISLANPSTVYIGASQIESLSEVQYAFLGKFVSRTNNGDATWDNYTNYSKIPLNEILYIPSDASIIYLPGTSTSDNIFPNFVLDKYQPVTGHAAIPANTSITYLGQLGGGARIEVGSYVGTGTYGSNNPCSVSASFPIKRLSLFGIIYADTGNYFPIYEDSSNSSYSMNDILLTTSFAPRRGIHKGTSSYDLYYSFGKKSADGKTFSWYSTGGGASFQLNESGITYYYIAIG